MQPLEDLILYLYFPRFQDAFIVTETSNLLSSQHVVSDGQTI